MIRYMIMQLKVTNYSGMVQLYRVGSNKVRLINPIYNDDEVLGYTIYFQGKKYLEFNAMYQFEVTYDKVNDND